MKSFKISGVLIYLFALVIVLFLYFSFVFTPLKQNTDSLNAQHAANTAQLAALEENLRNIDAMRASVEDLRGKIEEESSLSPLGSDMLSKDLSKGLNTSGAKFRSLSVSSSSEESSAQSLVQTAGVSMAVSGTAAQLQALAEYFETGTTGVYYINSISYSSEESGLLQANLEMTFYYYLTEAASP